MRFVRESTKFASLFAVAALLALVGCTKVAQPEQSAGTDSTLKQVLQRGTLRVGDCLTFAPFGFYNKDGQPDGYDVDLAKELAKQMGVKLEVVNTTSANRIPNLQTSKVDVVFCNFTRNLELVDKVTGLAKDKGCTPAQLALAWVLAQGDDVIGIPGTKRRDRLDENLGALEVKLSAAELEAIDAIFPPDAAAGPRYAEAMLKFLNA